MVGLSMALALGRMGVKVTLLDHTSFDMQQMPAFDGRVCALSLSSQRLMAHIGAWSDMQPHAQPILDIRVAEKGMSHYVHYDHRDVGSEPMGYIVENRHTRIALYRAASACTAITILAPARVASIKHHASHNTLAFEDGRTLSCQLLIAADGKFSATRQQVGISTFQRDYHQTAIVATIEHELPHHGLALEHFMPVGPFAVLPMTKNRSSLVWVESPDAVPAYLALDSESLDAEIQQRVGDYLGNVHAVGSLFHYPLILTHANHYYAKRTVLIGDAAHGMHPIAGQGVNLGFRDVAVLAEQLRQALKLGLDPASNSVLEQYASYRRVDTAAMLTITDALTVLFSNNNPVLKFGRNAGFSAVNQLPWLKKHFMLHAMGLSGQLPPLMQPVPEMKKAV